MLSFITAVDSFKTFKGKNPNPFVYEQKRSISADNCWLVRGSLFIELGCPEDLGKGWRGDLGTFMISRPI